MGLQSSKFQIQQKFQFISNYYDQKIGGQTKIYRTKDIHYKYFIKIQQIIDSSHIGHYEQNFRKFQYLYYQSQNFPFLRLTNLIIQQESACKLPKISFFVEFLRHNLKQFIQWRQKQERPLIYDEVMMILMKVIQANEQIKDYQIFELNLNFQDIYITIQGEIKFNPLSKKFMKRCSLSNSLRTEKNQQINELKRKILIKRFYQNESFNNSFITLDLPIHDSEIIFLNKFKIFANQLISLLKPIKNSSINPQQDNSYQQIRQLKRLLREIHRTRTLKQLKKLIGKTKIQNLEVDCKKQRFQQLQAKFQRLKNQLQSQQTTANSYRDSLSSLNSYNSLRFNQN